MRTIRLYQPGPLTPGQSVALCEDAANHAGKVLRMQAGEALELFNGDGNNYAAVIIEVGKKQLVVDIQSSSENPIESPLKLHLGQGISRGDRMDFAIQKAVELGVSEITPLFTERCGVKLDADRLEKKREQWQKIVISACEQSGRSVVPPVHQPVTLEKWLGQADNCLKLTLDPWTSATIKQLAPTDRLRLVIGPEGGFSDREVAATTLAGFQPVRLGPRVLRTETAALTAIAALQLQLGDLA
ncbi:16S rRNA (uracil(1498)-N(3))-methyltransferase [Rheinheimera tilapiae]|uniref:Ribosomal RNA small subunit methyltransferase E n=1 Tax=Rheinheimera tilapiae TaxID=875043 RepID=A0ABV6BF94_9GAMM